MDRPRVRFRKAAVKQRFFVRIGPGLVNAKMLVTQPLRLRFISQTPAYLQT